MSLDVLDSWNATTDEELSVELVDKFFAEPWDDELFVASAALDRVVDDTALARRLLGKALEVTENAVQRGKRALLVLEAEDSPSVPPEAEDTEDDPSSSKPSEPQTASSPPVHDERLLRLLSLRAIALQRLDLLETYLAIAADPSWRTHASNEASPPHTPEQSTTVDADEDEDDPWADEQTDLEPEPPVVEPETTPASPSAPPPITLSEFLTTDPLSNTIHLVEQSYFALAPIMIQRHHSLLVPYRLVILDAIPPYVAPSDYSSLLPSFNYSTNVEQLPTPGPDPRDPLDWVETAEALPLYQAFLAEHYDSLVFTPSSLSAAFPSSTPKPVPLTAEELSTWYITRIMYLDGEVGLTDTALELVQHGASQGIPGLDAIGEELSLLARLVYDTPGASTSKADARQWSLGRWRTLDERAVVRGYLARSTPQSIGSDIRKLVMPYLYVLEARAERAGQPDPDLPKRVLYDYVLRDATLALGAATFEASKPTLPKASRIIQDDEDLARLALARLYGSEELEAWGRMSAIFECLPDWPAPLPSSNGSAEEEGSSADTTLASLAAFVQPSASRVHAAPPEDLYIFFKPLPAPALSRALDILDVHLECGEIMARWGVPAPLAWFLQSAGDAREQRSWAVRMARRGVAKAGAVDEVARCTELLNDMLRLVGAGASGSGTWTAPEMESASAKGAFRMLGRVEVTKVFFSGLLSSGKFDAAKKFLGNSSVRKLASKSIEELCLTASREFYDNASSGNLHVGDMKLAYDCLTVPPSSLAVLAEREFIEATSRIASFNVQSQSAPGSTITPLEIRLVKDRLTLVARVLGESEDAYKYPEIVLELVRKLGYRAAAGDGVERVAEVKTWAMMSDSALQSEDFERAADMVEKMVGLLGDVKPLGSTSTAAASSALSTTSSTISASSSTAGSDSYSHLAEAVEVAWRACFQLGRQSEFHDTKRKLRLLGHALRLCPPENTLDILAVWRRVENEDLEAGKALRAARAASAATNGKKATNGNGSMRSSHSGRSSLFNAAASGTPSLNLSDYVPAGSRREHLLHQGADAAALAKQTFSRVTANWPFGGVGGTGGSGSNAGRERSWSRSGSERGGETNGAHVNGRGSPDVALNGIARSLTPDVGASARHALSRGMGWLIGDDE
ncbi:hypothetical protein DL93DRAFT_2067916 [Clavulina sp. PMI_390]|nr:hypothetical protein DL93DRAFT_2067916 [Clavulina sp. PMI_390]